MDTTDSEAVTEKQDAPEEEPAEVTMPALEDRYADRHLAAGQGGPAVRRRMTLHRARDTAVTDHAGTTLYQKPRKDERSGRDVGRNRYALTA